MVGISLLKDLRRNLFTALLLCSVAMLVCCVSSSDISDNEEQRDDIISYLESTHDPALIAESEIGSSLSTTPPFYSSFGDYAYRYIEDYFNVERDTKAEIKSGSKVLLNYRLYSFTGSNISDDTLPIKTNESLYESLYVDAGLNTEYWIFSPIEIVIYETTLIESIHQGLVGCKQGDIVEIYMTRNMAYNDDVIGVVEQESSLVFFCTILSVEN